MILSAAHSRRLMLLWLKPSSRPPDCPFLRLRRLQDGIIAIPKMLFMVIRSFTPASLNNLTNRLLRPLEILAYAVVVQGRPPSARSTNQA